MQRTTKASNRIKQWRHHHQSSRNRSRSSIVLDQQGIAFMLSLKMVSYTQFSILLTKKHAQWFYTSMRIHWKKNDKTALNALG